MKKNIAVIFFMILLMACETAPIKKVVKESYPNGKPKSVEFLQNINNKEELVEQKHYFENGQLKIGGKFENGKRTGKWVAYFENGNLQSEGVFENGVRSGYAKVYYPNGKLMYEGSYKNNLETGTWKFYNKAGEFVKEKTF